MKTFDLNLPVSKEEILEMTAGDIVYLSGRIVTLRDRSHGRIEEYAKKGLAIPFDLKDSAVLHCGPIIKQVAEDKWEAVAVGATSLVAQKIFARA